MEMDPAATFQYDPLDHDSDDIRVFRVLQTAEDVHLGLEKATLSEQHTAVSYVWGPPSPVEQIFVNGHPFEIRANLYAFLIEMKRQRQNQPCWVDAICIDQGNTTEKNYQVRNIHRMYEKAKFVYIWLGVGEADTVSLFRFLSNPADTKRHLEDKDFKLNSAVSDLVKYDYWNRTWIIPEVFLGRRKARLLLGPESLDWRLFSDFMNEHTWRGGNVSLRRSKAWEFCSSDIVDGDLSTVLFEGEDSSISCIHSFEKYSKVPGIGKSWWFRRLLILLDGFRTSECSDSRDRIYALLTMLGADATVVVDYTISASELYAKMLDIWMEGEYESEESTSLIQFCKIEALILLTLKLDRKETINAVAALWEEDIRWNVSLKLDALWDRSNGLTFHANIPDGIFNSEINSTKQDKFYPLQLPTDVCDCGSCTGLSLPTNKVLLFLSMGSSNSTFGQAPSTFFVIAQGDNTFFALAYGVSRAGERVIGFVRPFTLPSMDTTSMKASLEAKDLQQRTQTGKAIPEEDLWFDFQIRPVDLLGLVSNLGHGADASIGSLRPGCRNSFGERDVRETDLFRNGSIMKYLVLRQ